MTTAGGELVLTVGRPHIETFNNNVHPNSSNLLRGESWCRVFSWVVLEGFPQLALLWPPFSILCFLERKKERKKEGGGKEEK